MKKIIIVKTTIFLAIFSIILSIVYRVLVTPGDYQNYQWIAGFYEEKENNLDAVFIGGSSTYTFFEAPIAWHEKGITVYPFNSGAQPLEAALYMIKEGRNTQPNALYIINTNGLYNKIDEKHIHRIIAYMPISMNRLDLINALCDAANYPIRDRLEYYFPLLRFHSRWKELNKNDFHYTNDGLKGAHKTSIFLNNIVDVTSDFTIVTKRSTLPNSLRSELETLLDYCDAEGVKVLFVTSPQAKANEDFWSKINAINDLVQSRGYPYLNMLDYMEEINLDLATDYYEGAHGNIHGALKTTKFLTNYLVNNYGFLNKRGDSKYLDWDDAYNKYMRIIAPYVLDIETDYEQRDYTLIMPDLKNLNVNGTALTIDWKPSYGAEGYRIYRKEGNSAWKMLIDVDASVLTYTDKKCVKNKTYTYTIVPWQMSNSKKVWGEFNIKGLEATALLNAPVLISANKTDSGVKIVWKKVKDAAGYKIYRKLPNKDWMILKTVSNANPYVDATVMDNTPYIYTVQGYTVNNLKERVEGSMDQTGILYLPELKVPVVSATVGAEEIILAWEPIKGMNGHKVYRRTAETDWVMVAELPGNSIKFRDKPKDGQYAYRVEAFFKVGSAIHTFNLNNSFEWIDFK